MLDSIEYVINWLIDWLIDWLNMRLIDCSTEYVIDWLIDWLTDFMIVFLIDWLADWSIDWLIILGRIPHCVWTFKMKYSIGKTIKWGDENIPRQSGVRELRQTIQGDGKVADNVVFDLCGSTGTESVAENNLRNNKKKKQFANTF